MFNDFSKLNSAGSHGLVLRHAARYPIRSLTDIVTARLTEDGHQDAFQLGRRLGEQWRVLVFHSPVIRCAETAEGIVAGCQDVGQQAQLGGAIDELGGFYLRDPMMLVKLSATRNGFLRAWFDGEYPEKSIIPRDETAKRELAAIVKAWDETDSDVLRIFVTHDFNVLALREQYLNLRFEDVDWVEYLEGIVVSHGDNEILLRWAEHEVCLSVDEM